MGFETASLSSVSVHGRREDTLTLQTIATLYVTRIDAQIFPIELFTTANILKTEMEPGTRVLD